MESQFQKWVNLSYLAVSAVLGLLVLTLANKMVGTYDLETRVHNVALFVQVGAVACAAILFAILYRNDRANQFMNEVMLELSRVTWPTQKETTSATIVTFVMVLFSGIALGVMDYVWTALMKLVL